MIFHMKIYKLYIFTKFNTHKKNRIYGFMVNIIDSTKIIIIKIIIV